MPIVKIISVALENELATVPEAMLPAGAKLPQSYNGSVAVEGRTIRECLENLYPGFVEFTEVAAIVAVDSKAVLREYWDDPIALDSTIEIRFLPGYTAIPTTVAYVLTAVMVVAMVAMALLMPKPKTPDALPSPDPIYTLSGQQNRIKPMNPIDTPYGRNRIYPAYIARPYSRYVDNKQVLHQLFCLGQGDFTIEEIYIEDTALKNYPDVDYRIIEDFTDDLSENGTWLFDLFDFRMVTCEEVRGIELFGPNEEDYAIAGPFIVVPAGEKADQIEIDVSYPSGLYDANSKGAVEYTEIRCLFERQLIDDLGYPIGPWEELHHQIDRDNSLTPQFRTSTIHVPEGRYQIRARRTSRSGRDMTRPDHVLWESVKARLVSPMAMRPAPSRPPIFHPFSGDPSEETPPVYQAPDGKSITFIALRMVASNQLNDSVRTRFNVLCTRRPSSLVCDILPDLTTHTGTRSIAAAFIDVLTANYGARLTETNPLSDLDDEESSAPQFLHFDAEALRTLHEAWEAEGRYFDHVFSQKTTVWNALRAIARAGRAVPVIHGSRITMVRDRPRTLPVAVFNADNIVANSLKWESKAISYKDHDGVEVTYVDPMTGLQKTVMATLTESTPANPEKITLAGCTSKVWAYREGLYMLQSNKHVRQNITFKTGLEGMIPFYGDLITVAFPAYSWGSGGWLEEELDGAPAGLRRFRLSEPITWASSSEQRVVLLRRDDGTSLGPFDCFPASTDDEDEDGYLIDVDLLPTVGWQKEENRHYREPILFIVGKSEKQLKRCTVVSITPSEGEAIEIVASNYAPEIYQYDNATLPESTEEGMPDTPASLSRPEFLMAGLLDGREDSVIFTWQPVHDATRYLVSWQNGPLPAVHVYEDTTENTYYRAKKGDFYNHLNSSVSFSVVAQRPSTETESGWESSSTAVWTGRLESDEVSPVVRVDPIRVTDDGIEVRWSNVLNAPSYRATIREWDNVTPRYSPAPKVFSGRYPGFVFTVEEKNQIQDIYYPHHPLERSFSFLISTEDEEGNAVGPSMAIPVTIPALNAPVVQDDVGSGTALDPNCKLLKENSAQFLYEVQWMPPQDSIGVRGYRVYMGSSQNFEASEYTRIYEGINSTTTLTIPKDKNEGHPARYWKVAAFDEWSAEDSPLSREVKIREWVVPQGGDEGNYNT